MSKPIFAMPVFGFLLYVAGMVIANSSFAAEDVIRVVKAEGSVVTRDASGKHEKKVTSKSTLPPASILVTGADGRAVVRVGGTGYIVVEKNSRVEIGDKAGYVGFFRQLTGMIYYAMKAVRGDQPKPEVRTANATIGIRGTRFLVVDMPDRNEIGMRQGLVSVSSPDEDFEIHRKAEQDEFEAFKQQGEEAIAKEQGEFDEYKANSEREFVEYKREFSLGENRMASFDGKRVTDRPLSDESIKDMQSIESYAKEWLDEVGD